MNDDLLRVEALTPGCRIRYGGLLREVRRVQPGPVNTYVETVVQDGCRTVECTDGVERTFTSYKTFVFATGAWVKGRAS